MPKIYKFIGLLCINIVIVFIIDSIKSFLDIPSAEFITTREMENSELFFLVVLLAPFLEEIIYRYPLVKGKFIYFSLLGGILFYSIAEDFMLIFSACLNTISFILYFFYGAKKTPLFLTFFYAFAFTISHTSNYNLSELEKLPWYSLIFLFDAQIILSIILTYIRFNYQFRYTILYHSIYNFIIFLLYIFD